MKKILLLGILVLVFSCKGKRPRYEETPADTVSPQHLTTAPAPADTNRQPMLQPGGGNSPAAPKFQHIGIIKKVGNFQVELIRNGPVAFIFLEDKDGNPMSNKNVSVSAEAKVEVPGSAEPMQKANIRAEGEEHYAMDIPNGNPEVPFSATITFKGKTNKITVDFEHHGGPPSPPPNFGKPASNEKF